MVDDIIRITYEDLENVPKIVITAEDLSRLTPHIDQAYIESFYRRIRRQIANWATSKGAKHQHVEYILLAPDFFMLLARLAGDDRVPSGERVKLMAAIAYFVLPLDILPEAVLGPVGYIDDLALAAYVLSSVLKNTPESVIREHWEGNGDIIALIREILSKSSLFFSSEAWQRIRKSIFSPKGQSTQTTINNLSKS